MLKIPRYRITHSGDNFNCEPYDQVAKNICFITKWKTIAGRGISVDSHGYVYASGYPKIKVFTADVELVKEIVYSDFLATDLGVDENDYLYSIDPSQNNAKVVKFTDEGNIVLTFGSTWHHVK